jgi:hypothetical protein
MNRTMRKNTGKSMGGTKALVALAITALSVLGSTSAAWSFINDGRYRGGFVKPCSLDGVNPVYHPDIFGNPALAKAVYGFVLGRDRVWRVQDNCHIYN